MEDNTHPLVELLAARAKSHPQEFLDEHESGGRWLHALVVIERSGTAEDKALIAKTIGRVRMDEAHEWALDELLNGEERRAEERRNKELMLQQSQALMRQQAQARARALAQGSALQGSALQGYQNTLGQSQTVGSLSGLQNIGSALLGAINGK